MALDISNISFEGNSNASTNANASTNQNDNQDVSHLDGNGGDNHNLDTKDSQTPNNQQGNAEQNNNKDGGQGATGFHDATKGGDNLDGNSGDKGGSAQSSSTGGLDAGTQLDIDGKPYTVDAKDNEYIWFLIPTVLGTPTFTVGIFSGGFYKYAETTYKNISYSIYRSDNHSLGKTTINLS